MGPVITRLMGGLGNQMFQYAAGRALATRLGAPLLIDRTFIDERPTGMNWTARQVELDVFGLPLPSATTDQVRAFRRMRRPTWLRRQTWFRERDKRCDAAFFQLSAPVLLDGFWQSEGYFNGIAEELRGNIFQHKGQPSMQNLALRDRIRSTTSASVHVRLGDYLSNPEAASFHGLPDVTYYAESARELHLKHGVQHFFVFSDEPEKARARIDLPGDATYVQHNTGRDAHWDLWLMRQCRHHIIANSSFSWWGAWLNPSPDKVVIAPKTWFAGDPRPNDIVPATWLRR